MLKSKYSCALIWVFAPLLLGSLIYIFPHQFSLTVRNYFPDFFWAFSLIVAQYYFNSFNRNRWIIFIASSILCWLFELCQYGHIIKGTFDFIDIIVYHFAFLTAFLIIFMNKKGCFITKARMSE